VNVTWLKRSTELFGFRERRNLTPPSHIAPTLETYQRDYEREHLLRHPDHMYRDEHLLRQPDHMYRDVVSVHRETIRADPLYLNEGEYQAYGLVGRHELPSSVPVATAASATALGSYTNDPYYAYHYGASSVDPYDPNLRRQEVPSGSYPVGGAYSTEIAHLRHTESDQVEGLYSTYAADAPPPYNRTQHYQGTRPEAGNVPVSSRYSFACLSFPPQWLNLHLSWTENVIALSPIVGHKFSESQTRITKGNEEEEEEEEGGLQRVALGSRLW
jgi:hypothetical protein